MLHAGLSTVLGGRNPWRYCGRHGEILSAEHPPHLTHTRYHLHQWMITFRRLDGLSCCKICRLLIYLFSLLLFAIYVFVLFY